MPWALIASLAVVLSNSAAPAKVSKREHAAAQATASQSQTPSGYDVEAERQLLAMANQARAQAGLPPLQSDEGLIQAARAHADLMAEQQQLSHQFAGEPSLTHRLAANTGLHLEQCAENVASAPSVEQAYESLMLSPAHRQNLLDTAYNVAGFAVVRSGHTLYVTQDFGQGAIARSAQASKDIVAASVSRLRAEARLPQLQRIDDTAAQTAACTMARAGSLRAPLLREVSQGHYLLRYTSMEPENIPSSARKTVENQSVHAFSVGTCYARTASYPTGAYWVTLVFY